MLYTQRISICKSLLNSYEIDSFSKADHIHQRQAKTVQVEWQWDGTTCPKPWSFVMGLMGSARNKLLRPYEESKQSHRSVKPLPTGIVFHLRHLIHPSYSADLALSITIDCPNFLPIVAWDSMREVQWHFLQNGKRVI